MTTITQLDNKQISQKVCRVIDEVGKAIIGKRDSISLVLTAILCNGHILIEDVPGVGKTTLAKSLARTLGCSFRRIQFTPDLLPADITGTSIFNQKTAEFQFRHGPVFAQFVLADEINRATPKTQSSLLECMEERQVTVDGMTYHLPVPFFVIATENNVEYHGTYPLPEAQLDRFMMRVSIGYPGKSDELQILDSQLLEHPIKHLQQILSAEEVVNLQEEIKKVYMEASVRNYIIEIVSATRNHPLVLLGSSPRGSLNLSLACRAAAAIAGRDFVLPDDVKRLAVPILAHRLIMRPEARSRSASSKDVIREIIEKVPVPA